MKLFIFLALLLSVVAAYPCGLFLDNSTTLVFYPDGIDLRTISNNPTYSSYLDFQGLRLRINTANGQLEVVEIANENVVWSWGLTWESCATASCHLVFQSDGNLVLYYPSGNAIGTSTYNQGTQYVIFITSPPYILVVDGNCGVNWPVTGNGPNVGPLPRTTPVLGNTFSTTVTNKQALAANRWRSHFGVTTHMSQGWSSAMTYTMATYVGASIIRDGIPSSGQVADYQRMKSAGIKLNVVAYGVDDITELGTEVSSFATFHHTTVPGMLLQIEGFNEINNFPFTYNGVNPYATYAGMAQAMRDLYTLVKSNSYLSGVPVLDLTGGAFSDGAAVGLTNYSDHADFGAVHSYGYGGQPAISLGGTINLFLLSLAGSYPYWQYPTSNFAMTEIGYHTDNFDNGVSENAHGILIVNTLLNGILVGFRQTFIYELWDENWDGYDGPEEHFGLFRHDQTTKPGARALHFLSGLLYDTTTATTSNYNFTLDNLPLGAEYLLFQKSDGTVFLILWSNAPVWNHVLMQDLPISPVTSTLVLPSSKIVSLYNIYDTAANDTIPLPPSSVMTGTNISFSMGVQAVVLSWYPKSGNGLAAKYYNDNSFSSLIASRVDATINFNWGTGAPSGITGIFADYFSVRWSGFIIPRCTGIYTFTTVSDDGVRLYVNGIEIIDNWTAHAATTDIGTISLTAGQRYSIWLEYEEITGNAQISLSWSQDTCQPSQIIPQSQLYSS